MQQIDWASQPADKVEGFYTYHQDNPQVYDSLVTLARELRRVGRDRIGMGMLFEVLRWHYLLQVKTDEQFKLNNNYRAFYSRLIEEQCPDLRGAFTKRSSEADEVTLQ